MKKYDFGEVESSIFDFWKENQIYPKVKSKNKGNQTYYFLQGPPFTSGKIHIGHAWNNCMKDMILRYKRMKGFDVWDRGGYDMHGLPTEQKVQAAMGIEKKEEIEQVGVDKFVSECKKFSEEKAQEMDADLEKLGVWMDFKNAYWPIKNEFIQNEWFFIKQAYEQGRLYKGKKVMTWSAGCETALAKHELEYQTITDDSIFLKFRIFGSDSYLVIWTTTPWTIPFNLGVMVNPELDYVKARVEMDSGTEEWIVAKDLVGPLISGVADRKFEIIEEFKGETLEGVKYEHPLKDEVPFNNLGNDKLHSVLLSKEYVNTQSGSGLVHCAPGCGPEDYEVGTKYGLEPFNKLNEKGVFEEMGNLTGMTAKEDDSKFIDIYREKGALVAVSPIEHEYPFCWRSHKPVVFRLTEQWFLKTEDIIEQILKENESVNWVPEQSNESFKLWVKNLRDNGITRQRYWGCPVPIWVNEKDPSDFLVIGSKEELVELGAKNIPDDLHRPYIDDCVIERNDTIYRRIPDVLDVWIDSGTASWNCLEYPLNKEYFDIYFPADFILEATEQTKLWFTMLQICSVITFGKGCYKNVYTHGMLLSLDGTKMSKSLGNVISPYEVVDKYGVDVLRYYMCQTTAGKNISFSWDELKLKQKNLTILWNLQNYLLDLAAQIPEDAEPAVKGDEEKYMYSKLHSTIKSVTEAFDNYELDKTIGQTEELLLELSRTYLQMVRDKASIGSNSEKKLVLETVKDVLFGVLKLFSTTIPYITEEVYQNLKDVLGAAEESIHLYDWPEADTNMMDDHLEKSIGAVQDILQAGMAARERAGRNLRWPVGEIIVSSKDVFVNNVGKGLSDLIKRQLNVKKVTIDEFTEVDYDVKLNFKEVGKKYGQDVPTLAELAPDWNGKQAFNAIQKEGKFVVSKDGIDFELTKDDLAFEKKIPQGYTVGEFSQGSVYMVTEVTDELETEGYARELMRKIQSMRKEMGMQKTDVVSLRIKTDFEDIDLYSEHMKDKCGAGEVSIGSFDLEGEEVQIKDKLFVVSIKKI